MECKGLENFAKPADKRMMLGSFLRTLDEDQVIQLYDTPDDGDIDDDDVNIPFKGSVKEFVDSHYACTKEWHEMYYRLIHSYVYDHYENESLGVIIMLDENKTDSGPRNAMESYDSIVPIPAHFLRIPMDLFAFFLVIDKKANLMIVTESSHGIRHRCLAEGTAEECIQEMRKYKGYLEERIQNISVESGVLVISVKDRMLT